MLWKTKIQIWHRHCHLYINATLHVKRKEWLQGLFNCASYSFTEFLNKHLQKMTSSIKQTDRQTYRGTDRHDRTQFYLGGLGMILSYSAWCLGTMKGLISSYRTRRSGVVVISFSWATKLRTLRALFYERHSRTILLLIIYLTKTNNQTNKQNLCKLGYFAADIDPVQADEVRFDLWDINYSSREMKIYSTLTFPFPRPSSRNKIGPNWLETMNEWK